MSNIVTFSEAKKRLQKTLSLKKNTAAKKPDPKIITTDKGFDKSCVNCLHHSYDEFLRRHTCMQLPNADFHYVTTVLCVPNTRQYWTKKPSKLKKWFCSWFWR